MTDWRSFYESIELTEEELEEAIFQGKVKKYFKEKHKDYWNEQENKQGKTRRTGAKEKSS
jgi:hypothetical protein